jgi:hypothetical protein
MTDPTQRAARVANERSVLTDTLARRGLDVRRVAPLADDTETMIVALIYELAALRVQIAEFKERPDNRT